MLGENQRTQLKRYTNINEPHDIIVVARVRRYRSRGGSGHAIQVYIRYHADNEIDLPATISICRETYTAIDKAKEIGRYLRDDLGIETVRVRSDFAH